MKYILINTAAACRLTLFAFIIGIVFGIRKEPCCIFKFNFLRGLKFLLTELLTTFHIGLNNKKTFNYDQIDY
jgi:hypothetical protein